MLLSSCCIQMFSVTPVSLATCQRCTRTAFRERETMRKRQTDVEREREPEFMQCSGLMWPQLWYPPSQQTPQTNPSDHSVCVCMCVLYKSGRIDSLDISEPYVCKLPIITVSVCLFLACNVSSRMSLSSPESVNRS